MIKQYLKSDIYIYIYIYIYIKVRQKIIDTWYYYNSITMKYQEIINFLDNHHINNLNKTENSKARTALVVKLTSKLE